MSQKETDIATILRDNGLHVTKQRLLVFGVLENGDSLTMYELYELLKGRLDRASLYRIITTFENLGMVTRINIGWKYKIELSDKFTEHHHHLTCITCGTTIQISEDELESFIESLSRNHKFKPAEHQIEIQGYCDTCTKANP